MIDINAYVRHDKAEHNKKNIFFFTERKRGGGK